ncbi:MAG: methionine biosynthesis protein MetW [Pseudomonadota bacterium]
MPVIRQAQSLSRYDLQLIAQWIPANARVLDLGCGNGRLLRYLRENKQVTGYGIELGADQIAQCLENGINVIQTNLDQGLAHFDTNSFDYVVLSLTLQAMRQPRELLKEMLRVGKNGIVTFPNFAYWRNRLQMGVFGKMPVSDELPYHWYDTPNIHLCTIRDFRQLCEELDFGIDESVAVLRDGARSPLLTLMPNLFGEIALVRFSKLNDA